MAIVKSKNQKNRVWFAHAFLWLFCATILFPLLMVIAISFREGNYAAGSLIPSDPTLELCSGISDSQ